MPLVSSTIAAASTVKSFGSKIFSLFGSSGPSKGTLRRRNQLQSFYSALFDRIDSSVDTGIQTLIDELHNWNDYLDNVSAVKTKLRELQSGAGAVYRDLDNYYLLSDSDLIQLAEKLIDWSHLNETEIKDWTNYKTQMVETLKTPVGTVDIFDVDYAPTFTEEVLEIGKEAITKVDTLATDKVAEAIVDTTAESSGESKLGKAVKEEFVEKYTPVVIGGILSAIAVYFIVTKGMNLK
tara:strand:- start:5740 stop:6450 length:711 start_codon:yes stop_codon:yes gene_type:complete